jgi:hypothetical protein
MPNHTIRWMFAVVFAGCVQSPPPGSPISDPLDGARTLLSEQECNARGGSIVGDIGNGATHRSDYVCSSGKAPLGDVAAPDGGPFGDEGAVCCPR